MQSIILKYYKNLLNSPYFKRAKSKISETRKLSIFSLVIEISTEKQYYKQILFILYFKTLIEVIL